LGDILQRYSLTCLPSAAYLLEDQFIGYSFLGTQEGETVDVLFDTGVFSFSPAIFQVNNDEFDQRCTPKVFRYCIQIARPIVHSSLLSCRVKGIRYHRELGIMIPRLGTGGHMQSLPDFGGCTPSTPGLAGCSFIIPEVDRSCGQ
jgi:hypothetical protein